MVGNVRVIAEALEPAAEPVPEPQLTQDDLVAAFRHLEQMGLDGVVTPIPVAPPAAKVVVKRAMPDREILAAMSGLGALLAVRLMLALAVGGAFWLAWMAMSQPTFMAISVLLAYALTTVGPLVWLSTKRT